MTNSSAPLALVIDGNNLAHHIFHLNSSKKITTTEIHQTAEMLIHYAWSTAGRVQIELCLDPLPPEGEMPLSPALRIFIARPIEKADDLIIQRFRFHHFQTQPCVVVTNDGEVLERVREEGGTYLRVYDFVRRAGTAPVFLKPDEFAPYIHPNRHRHKKPAEDSIIRVTPSRPQNAHRSGRKPGGDIQKIKNEIKNSEEAPIASVTPAVEPEEPIEETPSPPREPSYRLTLQSWPLEAGVHFLLSAFCDFHGKEFKDLYHSVGGEDLRPADLEELVDALLSSCGNEPDFARRGSLMKRVRLALLQVGDQPLTLSSLAERTGLPLRGLHGRIKTKAAPWIEIIP